MAQTVLNGNPFSLRAFAVLRAHFCVRDTLTGVFFSSSSSNASLFCFIVMLLTFYFGKITVHVFNDELWIFMSSLFQLPCFLGAMKSLNFGSKYTSVPYNLEDLIYME